MIHGITIYKPDKNGVLKVHEEYTPDQANRMFYAPVLETEDSPEPKTKWKLDPGRGSCYTGFQGDSMFSVVEIPR